MIIVQYVTNPVNKHGWSSLSDSFCKRNETPKWCTLRSKWASVSVIMNTIKEKKTDLEKRIVVNSAVMQIKKLFIFVRLYKQWKEHMKVNCTHQLSPSLITSMRTRQLYEKIIMPRRYGWHNNIECRLSWIMAPHIRISLNHPLESNRNHTAIEVWVATANYTVRAISTHAYQCVKAPLLCLMSTFLFSSPFLHTFHSTMAFL